MLIPSGLKYFIITLFLILGILVGLIRFQGWQYIAALTDSGFATSLPDAASLPMPVTCTAKPLRVLSYNVMYGSTTIEAMAERFRGGDYWPRRYTLVNAVT